MSLDGRIGKEKEQIVFSNRLDSHRVGELRESVDAVIVGIETILEDDPEIPLKGGEGETIKIIVDKGGDTPLDARILAGDGEVLIAVSKGASQRKRDRLMMQHPNVTVLEIGQHAINLKNLLWKLYERGIKRVLIEGGLNLTRRMLDEGHVNEIYLTIAPILIGDGVNFVHGKLSAKVDLRLEGIRQYGDQVVLHYKVK